MDYRSTNVVVTGSSAGIGKATAESYMKNGANVIIHGASLKGEEVARELNEKYDSKATFIRADLAKMEDVRYLYEESVRTLGKVDILVNCAGIVPAGTVLDFSEKDFDEAFDVNVKSVFFLSKMFLEHMLENGRGNIVNIASIAGLIGPKNRALYSASKGAVISLTRAMAMDHADTGVRINCICPGMVYSPSLEKRIEATDDPEETYRIFRNNIPMKRIGTVEEIAQAVLFVTGDENSFMTGSIINVDGGAGL
ncbi:MAG: SDR family oxidoreductase [Erysipelotrichaceae bacterium]|nr:SDR family oxidoreductase [Erysipelotrichaceae bacterium]